MLFNNDFSIDVAMKMIRNVCFQKVMVNSEQNIDLALLSYVVVLGGISFYSSYSLNPLVRWNHCIITLLVTEMSWN